MSTIKVKVNLFQIQCDVCRFKSDDRSDAFHGDEFVAMNSSWKRKGGVTVKYRGAFVNWCEKCAEQKKREMFLNGEWKYPNIKGES